jgi:iron complex outermembrane receptor protein
MVTTDAQYVVKGVVNLPLSDKIAVRLNGFYDHIDPLIKNRGTGGGIMSQRNYGFQGKILFNFSDDVDLVVTGNYSNLYNSFGPNFVVVPITGPLGDLQRALYGVEFGRGVHTQNLDSPTYNKAYGGSVVAELNARLTDNLKLTSITGYRSVKNRTLTDTDNGPFGVVAGRGYAPGSNAFPLFVVSVGDALNPEDYRYFSEELRATYSSEQLDIVAGGFYQNFKEDRKIRFTYIYDGSYLGLTPGVKYYSQNFNTTKIPDTTYAIFGDATYKATSTFNIFGGLRYTKERIGHDWTSTNYFNPVEGFFNPITLENSAPPVSAFAFSSRETVNNLSGRVGAQWLPGKGHNLYATASRGYKGPAIDQSLSTPGDATSILKPEIATSFEIGAKERLFDGRLALDISIYRTDIKNVQQTSIPPGEITAVLINAGTLKSKGFEVMAHGRVIDGLELSGSVGFVDAHYKGGRFACNATQIPGVAPCDPDGTLSLTGQRAIGTPKWKYILGADAWHNLTSTVQATARASYTWRSSIQYSLNDDPFTREPSAGILNASIGVKDRAGKWAVDLFVNNITNHFYYNHLGNLDFFEGRLIGNMPRDFKRYGGLRASLNF